MMPLDDYLRDSRGDEPAAGAYGVESEWMPITSFEVLNEMIWIGDPQFAWAEANECEGCRVKAPNGKYLVEAKGIEFDGVRYVARVRVYRDGSTEFAAGEVIGEAETDSAQLGVADPDALKTAFDAACGDDEDAALDLLEEGVDGDIGVFEPQAEHTGRLIFFPSGIGDGGGPVWELVSGDQRIGIEHEMIDAAEPF